jgi:hypothetical protein
MMRGVAVVAALSLVAGALCATVATPGPLTTGSYALTPEQLATPWEVDAGSVSGAAQGLGGGALDLTGYLWWDQSSLSLSGRVWSLGGKPRCLLTLDLNGNGTHDDEAPVVGELASATATSLRFTFPEVKAPSGALSLALQVPRDGGSGRVRVRLSRVLKAVLPAPPGKYAVRMPETRAGASLAWLDTNADGLAQDEEVVTLSPGQLLGVNGALRAVAAAPASRPTKVTVAAPRTPLGKLDLRVADAAGRAVRPTQAELSSTTVVRYIRPRGVLMAPVGAQSVMYSVPVGGGRTARFTAAAQARVQAGKAVIVRAGGRLQISPSITARNGEVIVETAPATTGGDRLSGFSGPGESGGLLKVFAPDGKLVLRAPLEFG